jgi:hypothetical protein
MAPPDSHQLQTIEQFTPTTVGHLFDSAMPPVQVFSRGRTVRTKHRLLNVPAQWNVLDELLMPSRDSPVHPPVMRQSRAFTGAQVCDHERGLPLFSRDLQKNHRQRLSEYRNSLRYAETCDNQVEEERIRSLVAEERSAMASRRETTARACADIGQTWALRALGMLPKKKPKKVVQPISVEDAEAMRELSKRDEEIMDEYREKKKEREEMLARGRLMPLGEAGMPG